MRAVEILQRPSPDQVERLVRLVERAAEQRGERPLSDHLWLDLNAGGRSGFVAVTAADATGLLGMAQISATNDAASLESFVVDHVDDPSQIRDDISETAIDVFRADGGGRLFWWVDEPGAADEAFAAANGLAPVRGLVEMRRALPLDRRSTVDTRPFVPGVDDDAWIEVNNRAFAGHDEQGGWTRDLLALRMSEPWFDPDGFRLHDVDGRLAAFCWTKLHSELDPVVGEIYVIAVDPDFHGRGLGRELTLAGLDSIADRGVIVATLFVDTANTAAVALYESIGFTIHRRRQAYAGDIRSREVAP